MTVKNAYFPVSLFYKSPVQWAVNFIAWFVNFRFYNTLVMNGVNFAPFYTAPTSRKNGVWTMTRGLIAILTIVVIDVTFYLIVYALIVAIKN